MKPLSYKTRGETMKLSNHKTTGTKTAADLEKEIEGLYRDIGNHFVNLYRFKDERKMDAFKEREAIFKEVSLQRMGYVDALSQQIFRMENAIEQE